MVFLEFVAGVDVFAREIGPEDNLCRAINDAESGNEIVLRPGEHRGPCTIRRGGTAERPLVIRALDPERRARIVYEGESANVLEVRADHVVIKGLAFGPTRKSVDGVRIRARQDVSVIDCAFVGMGGIAVAANQSTLQGLLVKGNSVSMSGSTAMYFGCQDGDACRVSDIVIEKNHIGGVNAAESEVGYGMQVKLNSSAIIRDNVVTDTKGPGIMVYGARDRLSENLIERNFVSGSRTSSGIVIGGGPAVVRNNVAVGNALAGIALLDYAHWGLLHQIKVGFNTLLENGTGAITATQDKVVDCIIAGNVGWASARGELFPPQRGGLVAVDNVACEKSCFADIDVLDLAPARNSLLDKRTVGLKAGWFPQDDYYSQQRKTPPRPGAVEAAGRTLGDLRIH